MSSWQSILPGLSPSRPLRRLASTLLLSVLPPIVLPVVLGISVTLVRAAEIHPALRAELSMLDPTETATAFFILDRQADISSLDRELKLAHSTRGERHRRVVQSLQAAAQESQAPFLEELERRSAGGEVIEYSSYWIVNAVAVRAMRGTIEELAGRGDIAAVEPGFRAVPDQIGQDPTRTSVRDQDELPDPGSAPILERRSSGPQAGSGSRGIGVAQGLRAINAPRVWYELGINGEGALIGILDTGVDGYHAALVNRWRGNNGHPWQECWHDVIGPPSNYPGDDGSGHGTHVAGILAGLGAATEDTIGVAWGAQWIAANAISQSVGHELDFDVFDCLQWFADPDGNPETVDDVPDVLLNAWGVSEFFSGYTDCDARWWPAIDNCEAAGVALVWTAGGDGPADKTIRSPGDRATTVYNAFSIGAVDAAHSDFPYPITFFSSRGPSGCDVADPLKIKPEVVAPGVDIYSSYPGGSYQVWSGTAMASAHAAGVVALMRAADPDIEVDTIKQILMETARDGGVPGEDNTYGWGTIDAYEAVARIVTAAGEGGVPNSESRVLVAQPNPFAHETTLRFSMKAPGPATLTVHDPGGRLVRLIPLGPVSAGTHTATWDGRDESGRLVPAGVYFARLILPGACGRTTMLVLR